MSEIYIFSQDDDLLTILSESTGLISAPFKDHLNTVPDEPFVFTLDADEERAKYVKEENRVVFKDKDGFFREMVIKEIDDIDNNDGPQTTAICLPAWLDELSENYVLDKRYTDKEAQVALNDALAGTRYIGEVEVSLGLASTNFYKLTSADCIWKIINVWGGEFKDTIEFTGNKITTRKILIKQRLGADRGAGFEIDHNIEEIQRTVLSYPKTAMYGWGASLEIEDEDGNLTGGHTRYIDFADVEWSVAKGNPVDKPKGQKWVGDPDALLKYGRKHEGKLLHRYGEYSNQEIEDPEEILWATWNNLQEAKKPEVNYRLSVDMLDKDASLGDTARAIDREFARPIEIQTRVIAIEYDLLDIEGTAVVEMGQFLDLDDDRLDRLENYIEENQGKWGAEAGPITNDRFPNIKPDTPINVEATGGIETIQLYWDYDEHVYISHYEVYGSPVKDFVPDTQHLLWRGRVSGFAHEVGTAQRWYYYVRAVNTHGRASEYSQQVSAATSRVGYEDIEQDVKNSIDTARNKADEAVEKVNLATGNANQAIEDAQEAFNKATNAHTIADAAKDLADVTNKLALTIKETVDGHSVQIKENETEISRKMSTVDANAKFATQSQLTQTSSSLTSEIAKVQGVLDGIEIGTTNLVSNSKRIEKEKDVSYAVISRGLPQGEYTISFDYEIIEESAPITSFLIYAGHSIAQVPLKKPGQDRTQLTFILPAASEGKDVYLYLGANAANSRPNQGYFLEVMLVKGNKSGTWQPAPEDMTTNIQFSRFEQTVESISTQVTKKVDKTIYDSFVQQTAQSLSSKISQQDADNKYATQSSLAQTAEGLQSTVKAVQGDLANLNVGGSNIILNSDTQRSSTSYQVYGYYMSEDWELNTSYSVAIKGEINSGQNFGMWANGSQTKVASFKYDSELGLHIATFKTPASITATTSKRAYVYNVPSTGAKTAKIEWIKLVKGNVKITDWSPAPEDTNARFDSTQSQITQLAGVVDSKITKGQADGWYASQSQLTQTASSLQSTIKGVRDDLDGLEIGGRNLILGSGTPYTYDVGPNDFNYNIFYRGLEKNTTYTFSAKVEILQGNITYVSIYPYLQSGQNMARVEARIVNGYIKGTFTTDNRYNYNLLIYNGQAGSTTGNRIRLSEYKLEKGNKATDWSPAPEDMATQSQISQLATDINFRVKKGDTITQINIDGQNSSVLIDGKYVHITGQTKIDNGVIKTLMVADGTIINSKIGNLAVDTAKLANAAVTNAKIASLRADKIDGGIINGNVVTVKVTNGKQELRLDDTGLRSIDSSGRDRIHLGVRNLAGKGQSDPATLRFFSGNGSVSAGIGMNVNDHFIIGSSASDVAMELYSGKNTIMYGAQIRFKPHGTSDGEYARFASVANTGNTAREVAFQPNDSGHGYIGTQGYRWWRVYTNYLHYVDLVNLSTRDSKANIHEANINQMQLAFDDMDLVTFNYKDENGNPRDELKVGWIAEDSPSLITSKDKKQVSLNNTIGVMAGSMKYQQKRVDQLEKVIEDLVLKIAKLEAS
ncbi:phage tail protein [Lederbergia galactosidilytica]|uniref:phage tail protein n=1 Tax=Lederbergia galactosidilytica TaxID=217031 RepID=UPI0007DB2DCB|nr:phage tail protein [Lederbergia galactosidilytica]